MQQFTKKILLKELQIAPAINSDKLDDYELTNRLSDLLYRPGILEVAGYIRSHKIDPLYVFYPNTRCALHVYYDVCRGILAEEQANRIKHSEQLHEEQRQINMVIFDVAKALQRSRSVEFALAWRFIGHRAEIFMHSSDLTLDEAMSNLFEELVEYSRIGLGLD